MSQIYSKSRLNLISDIQDTGLIRRMALNSFKSGQVRISGTYQRESPSFSREVAEILPLLSKEQFISKHPTITFNKDDPIFLNDSVWVKRLKHRLDEFDRSEIWNGNVVSVSSVTDTEEIIYQPSDYFSVMSYRERRINNLLDESLNESEKNPQDYSIFDINTRANSHSGISYILSVDDESSSKKQMLFGNRSSNLDVNSNSVTTVPAGVVEEIHINDSFDSMIQSHFAEEFTEEVFNETLSEETVQNRYSDNISYNFLGFGVHPVTFTVEYLVEITISGELAKIVIEENEYNEEYSSFLWKPYTSTDVSSIINMFESRNLSPQTKFGIGLWLAEKTELDIDFL